MINGFIFGLAFTIGISMSTPDISMEKSEEKSEMKRAIWVEFINDILHKAQSLSSEIEEIIMCEIETGITL